MPQHVIASKGRTAGTQAQARAIDAASSLLANLRDMREALAEAEVPASVATTFRTLEASALTLTEVASSEGAASLAYHVGGATGGRQAGKLGSTGSMGMLSSSMSSLQLKQSKARMTESYKQTARAEVERSNSAGLIRDLQVRIEGLSQAVRERDAQISLLEKSIIKLWSNQSNKAVPSQLLHGISSQSLPSLPKSTGSSRSQSSAAMLDGAAQALHAKLKQFSDLVSRPALMPPSPQSQIKNQSSMHNVDSLGSPSMHRTQASPLNRHASGASNSSSVGNALNAVDDNDEIIFARLVADTHRSLSEAASRSFVKHCISSETIETQAEQAAISDGNETDNQSEPRSTQMQQAFFSNTSVALDSLKVVGRVAELQHQVLAGVSRDLGAQMQQIMGAGSKVSVVPVVESNESAWARGLTKGTAGNAGLPSEIRGVALVSRQEAEECGWAGPTEAHFSLLNTSIQRSGPSPANFIDVMNGRGVLGAAIKNASLILRRQRDSAMAVVKQQAGIQIDSLPSLVFNASSRARVKTFFMPDIDGKFIPEDAEEVVCVPIVQEMPGFELSDGSPCYVVTAIVTISHNGSCPDSTSQEKIVLVQSCEGILRSMMLQAASHDSSAIKAASLRDCHEIGWQLAMEAPVHDTPLKISAFAATRIGSMQKGTRRVAILWPQHQVNEIFGKTKSRQESRGESTNKLVGHDGAAAIKVMHNPSHSSHQAIFHSFGDGLVVTSILTGAEDMTNANVDGVINSINDADKLQMDQSENEIHMDAIATKFHHLQSEGGFALSVPIMDGNESSPVGVMWIEWGSAFQDASLRFPCAGEVYALLGLGRALARAWDGLTARTKWLNGSMLLSNLFTTDGSKMLQAVERTGHKLFNAQSSSVYIVQHEGNSATSSNGSFKLRRMQQDGRPSSPLPLQRGIAWSTAAHGEAQLVKNVNTHPEFRPLVDSPTGVVVETLMSAPCRSPEGRLMGVVQFVNKRIPGLKNAASFSRGDMEQAIWIADQIGSTLSASEELMSKQDFLAVEQEHLELEAAAIPKVAELQRDVLRANGLRKCIQIVQDRVAALCQADACVVWILNHQLQGLSSSPPGQTTVVHMANDEVPAGAVFKFDQLRRNPGKYSKKFPFTESFGTMLWDVDFTHPKDLPEETKYFDLTYVPRLKGNIRNSMCAVIKDSSGSPISVIEIINKRNSLTNVAGAVLSSVSVSLSDTLDSWFLDPLPAFGHMNLENIIHRVRHAVQMLFGGMEVLVYTVDARRKALAVIGQTTTGTVILQAKSHGAAGRALVSDSGIVNVSNAQTDPRYSKELHELADIPHVKHILVGAVPSPTSLSTPIKFSRLNGQTAEDLAKKQVDDDWEAKKAEIISAQPIMQGRRKPIKIDEPDPEEVKVKVEEALKRIHHSMLIDDQGNLVDVTTRAVKVPAWAQERLEEDITSAPGILKGRHSIACIEILGHTNGAGFTHADESRLKILCERLSAALQSAMLHDEVSMRNTRFERVHVVASHWIATVECLLQPAIEASRKMQSVLSEASSDEEAANRPETRAIQAAIAGVPAADVGGTLAKAVTFGAAMRLLEECLIAAVDCTSSSVHVVHSRIKDTVFRRKQNVNCMNSSTGVLETRLGKIMPAANSQDVLSYLSLSSSSVKGDRLFKEWSQGILQTVAEPVNSVAGDCISREFKYFTDDAYASLTGNWDALRAHEKSWHSSSRTRSVMVVPFKDGAGKVFAAAQLSNKLDVGVQYVGKISKENDGDTPKTMIQGPNGLPTTFTEFDEEDANTVEQFLGLVGPRLAVLAEHRVLLSALKT